MAPQDASLMRLYRAMADVAPFLFIVFQHGELLAAFSSMVHESSASVHPRWPSEFCFLRRTDLLQSKAAGVARPLVTGCGERSRLVPVGDYAAMMKTGIVCRKPRSIDSGKDAQVVESLPLHRPAVSTSPCL